MLRKFVKREGSVPMSLVQLFLSDLSCAMERLPIDLNKGFSFTIYEISKIRFEKSYLWYGCSLVTVGCIWSWLLSYLSYDRYHKVSLPDYVKIATSFAQNMLLPLLCKRISRETNAEFLCNSNSCCSLNSTADPILPSRDKSIVPPYYFKKSIKSS